MLILIDQRKSMRSNFTCECEMRDVKVDRDVLINILDYGKEGL